MKKSLAVLPVLAFLAVGCSQVNPGTQAIEKDSYGAPTLGNCVVGPANPGTMTVDLIRFPSRQITWDATGDQGAEANPYAALSKPASPPLAPGQQPGPDFSTGQAEMAIPVTLTFDLTQNCDELKEFYTKYATKDEGWLDDDGKPTPGWIKLLNYTVSQPAQQAIIRITQKYPWQKVWNDEGVRVEYQQQLTADLQKEAATRTGGKEYFSNFLVTVGKPYPTDQALRDAVAAQQSSQAQANSAQTKATADANARRAAAQADTDAANAEVAAKVAEAAKQKAVIDGFGSLDGYLRWLCITTPNCTMFGPSPIIAGAPAH
jgi:hypothetical protein